MYKLLLILKYLRRKLAPMFAALAVTLCTMMVIIVISVMGGFLDLLRTSAHRATGDVIVTAFNLAGFAGYERLAEELEELPEVAAVTPVIESYGIINMRNRTIPVRIQGIRPSGLEQVRPYRETLYWQTEDYLEYFPTLFGPEEKMSERDRRRLEVLREQWAQIEPVEYGMTLEPPVEWQADPEAPRPGAVLGIEVNPHHVRDDQGQYSLGNAALGEQITLTVVPVSARGDVAATGPAYQKLVVVNEFKSGLYDIDANQVFVPFEVLQRLLDMHSTTVWPEGAFDPETGEPVGEPIERPARTSHMVLKAAPGYTFVQARDAAEAVLQAFVEANPDLPPLYAITWAQQHEGILNAVQNEKGLVTFLFIIISLVAVVMVLTTFYMIVLEKTRDIGVLRALGASRLGIVNVFLGYGLAIGVVGSTVGFGLAYAVVTNLNEIQAFVAATTGWQMWDPQTYFFDRIPTQLDPVEVTVIIVFAIISSVAGALIPAVLAGLLNPVEALRYE